MTTYKQANEQQQQQKPKQKKPTRPRRIVQRYPSYLKIYHRQPDCMKLNDPENEQDESVKTHIKWKSTEQIC